jgi:hypothetical protein
MYAIFWGIKKFEYELRGRRFQLVTDHKALEEIRKKGYFENNRVNRWIEKIQEFDFEVRYEKGEELAVPDALSRLYEEGDKDKNEFGEKLKKIAYEKHAFEKDEQEYWKFDSGHIAKIPKVEDRGKMIIDVHEELKHRSMSAVYHKIRKEWYWPNMKQDISIKLKGCETCQIWNRKNSGGCEFVTTSRPFEKVALDMIDIRNEGRYVLVCIDYFTRIVKAKVLENKKTDLVVETLKYWMSEGVIPEEIITDNGKEFASEMFRKMCSDYGAKHMKVSVESHRSNGRVERVIGTLEKV